MNTISVVLFRKKTTPDFKRYVEKCVKKSLFFFWWGEDLILGPAASDEFNFSAWDNMGKITDRLYGNK
jgi:hypothetical protein